MIQMAHNRFQQATANRPRVSSRLMSLIIDAPAFKGGTHHGGLVGIDGYRNPQPAISRKHRQQAPQLFGFRRMVWPPGAKTRRRIENIGPCLQLLCAMPIARSTSHPVPSPENESGVRLTMPMMSGRASGSLNKAAVKFSMAEKKSRERTPGLVLEYADQAGAGALGSAPGESLGAEGRGVL
jgi:hypothetical protein